MNLPWVSRSEWQAECARACRAERDVIGLRQQVDESRERLTRVMAELAALRSQEALEGVPFDVCPNCGADSWVRLGTLVRAQHDSKQERVSPGGSWLACTACRAEYHLLPVGLVKPAVHEPAAPVAAGERKRDRIPVKLPGGRSL